MAVVAIKGKTPQYDYGEYGPQVNIGGDRIISKPGSDLGPKGGTQSVDSYLQLLSQYGLTDTDYTGGAKPQNKAPQMPSYSSPYSSQIDSLLDSILNREKFSYDVDSDPLYQQYKTQYTREGNRAMRDTMGNAAALTGGYGSSYGTTAGSQAYDYYLSMLNDRVPELEQQAYAKYMDEGNGLYNQLSAYQGLEDRAYNQYRDQVGDYYNDLEQQFRMDQFLYGQGQDAQAQANWDKEFDYKGGRDTVNDKYREQESARDQANWDETFNFNKSQAAISNALAWQKASSKTSETKHSEAYELTRKRAEERLDGGRESPDSIISWVINQNITDEEAEAILRYLGLDGTSSKKLVGQAQKPWIDAQR